MTMPDKIYAAQLTDADHQRIYDSACDAMDAWYGVTYWDDLPERDKQIVRDRNNMDAMKKGA